MKSYNCVVCIKQVPDTKKVTGQAMKEDGTINRAALPAIFNPEDRNALEAALFEFDFTDRFKIGGSREIGGRKTVQREFCSTAADLCLILFVDVKGDLSSGETADQPSHLSARGSMHGRL